MRASARSDSRKHRRWERAGRGGAVTFVRDGESRSVDLSAPVASRRGRRHVVSLMDLWVASLLPGDFLDLVFEVIPQTEGAPRSFIDALRFARAYVDVDTRELWWDDGEDAAHGVATIDRIVVHARSSEPAPPPPESRVEAAPRAEDSAPAATSAAARIERMLPSASTSRYPSIAWSWKSEGAARIAS